MALEGKVALITGSAQGLGKAFAEVLLRKGAKVCIADINITQGECLATAFQQTYGKGKVLFTKCDVSLEEDFKNSFTRTLSQFGRLDIMVNNAGILNEFNYKKMVDINLTGVITGTTLAINVMSKEKGGHGGLILNIASTAGITPAAYFTPSYTATKFGVVGYTRSWAMNPYIKKMGLRFACLCPSFTQTEMLKMDTTLYQQDALKVVDKIGINSVDSVADAFSTLVENEKCNGAVVTITAQDGIQYYKKPLIASGL